MSKILIKHKTEKEVSISFNGKQYKTENGYFLLEKDAALAMLNHRFEIVTEEEKVIEEKNTETIEDHKEEVKVIEEKKTETIEDHKEEIKQTLTIKKKR